MDITTNRLRCTCLMLGISLTTSRALCQIPQTNDDNQALQAAVERARAVQNPKLQVPERYRLERGFQSGAKCGPNALFVLLKLHGADVRYEQITERLATSEKGTSMLQLSECAKQFGIETEIRGNVAPDDLKSSVLPAIVHLTAVGNVRDPAAPADHFLLILEQTKNGEFSGIDTTDMTRADYTRETLARTMSGVVLFVTNSHRIAAYKMVQRYRYAWMAVGLVWMANGAMIIRAWRMSSNAVHGIKK